MGEALMQWIGIFMRRADETETDRRDGDVTTEAETRMTQPQATERWGSPGAGRGEKGPPPRASGGSTALPTP